MVMLIEALSITQLFGDYCAYKEHSKAQDAVHPIMYYHNSSFQSIEVVIMGWLYSATNSDALFKEFISSRDVHILNY